MFIPFSWHLIHSKTNVSKWNIFRLTLPFHNSFPFVWISKTLFWVNHHYRKLRCFTLKWYLICDNCLWVSPPIWDEYMLVYICLNPQYTMWESQNLNGQFQSCGAMWWSFFSFHWLWMEDWLVSNKNVEFWHIWL